MSRIQKQDYYFGAALSMFLSKNKDARPSIVEATETSRQYNMMTDTSETFSLYMKYTSSENRASDGRVWQSP